MDDYLRNRYGGQSRLNKPTKIFLAAAVCGCLAWLFWTAWVHANPAVKGGLTSFKVLDDQQVTAKFSVRLANPDTQGFCLLRATATDHTNVGEKSIIVNGPDLYQELTATINTERKATSVALILCNEK